MVISELLTKATKILTENGLENPRFEAGYFVAHILKMSQTDLVLNCQKTVDAVDEEELMHLLKRRISGEPFQYILGTQEFMGLTFSVAPCVLIPRQDTETLVEFVLDKTENTPLNILDIGTGSGCIPISLAYFRSNFRCVGIDLSEDAIKLAKKNSESLSVSDRVSFKKCDILTEIPNSEFDIIISNPPYIKSEILPTLQTEVRDFEPNMALDGGTDGLTFYRRICGIAPRILKNNGLLAFEIGFDQADEVTALMAEDFSDITVTKDLSGNNRVVSGVLRHQN